MEIKQIKELIMYKPVIPREVADYIEKCKNDNLTPYVAMDDLSLDHFLDDNGRLVSSKRNIEAPDVKKLPKCYKLTEEQIKKEFKWAWDLGFVERIGVENEIRKS